MPTATQVRRVLLQLDEEDNGVQEKLEAIKAKADELAADNPTLKPQIDRAAASASLKVLRDEIRDTMKDPPPVELTADDEAALAKLDDVRAKLDDLKTASASVEIKADDKQAQLALLRLQLKMDELKAKVVDPEFELRGVGRAEVELAALDLEMDRLKSKSDSAPSGGFIGRMLNGNGSGGGMAEALQNIPVLGGQLSKLAGGFGKVADESESTAGGLGDIAAAGPAAIAIVAALAVALGGVLAEADALATGLMAAGAGVGAFALLAVPAFSKVTGAYAQINKDQDAYDNALTKTAKNTALKKLHQDLKSLDPAQRTALSGLQNLMNTFHKMSTAFEPTAFKVFNEGLKIANQLLPYVAQFANAAAPAIEGLMTSLSKGIDSSSFKGFMGYLSSLSGPVITAVGSGMKGIAGDLRDLFTIMSKKDVINGINIAFRVLGAAIDTVIFFIRLAMGYWDVFTAEIRAVAGVLAGAVRDARRFARDFAHAFDTARHDVARAFDTVRHDIAAAIGAIGSFIKGHIHQIIAWLVDPIGMAVREIKTHTHQIADAFDTARHDIARSVDVARHDVASAFDTIRHDIAAAADWIPHAIRGAWDTVRRDTASAFDAVRHAVASGVDAALAVIRRLPGQILSALAALPGQMLNAGRNIIMGLVHGIESAASAIPSIMHQLASDVSSYFTDPLKIFSPSRVFMEHGENVAKGLALGITRGTGGVRQAVGHMTAAVTGPGALAPGAGPGAGQVPRLQIEWTGGGGADAQFLAWLMKNLRVRGANVAVIGGAV